MITASDEPTDIKRRKQDLELCPVWVVKKLENLERENAFITQENENLKDKIVHLVTGGRGGEDYEKLEDALNSTQKELELVKSKLAKYEKPQTKTSKAAEKLSFLTPRSNKSIKELQRKDSKDEISPKEKPSSLRSLIGGHKKE